MLNTPDGRGEDDVEEVSQSNIGSGTDEDDVDRASQSNIGSGMWGGRIPICLHCTTSFTSPTSPALLLLLLLLLLLHKYSCNSCSSCSCYCTNIRTNSPTVANTIYTFNIAQSRTYLHDSLHVTSTRTTDQTHWSNIPSC